VIDSRKEVPCKVGIHLGGGQVLRHETRTYPGFVNSPLPWDAVEQKFHELSDACADRVLRDAIVNAVANLDQLQISELAELLGRVPYPVSSGKAA
jgi:2-methylcitrate dehydratase PrpD